MSMRFQKYMYQKDVKAFKQMNLHENISRLQSMLNNLTFLPKYAKWTKFPEIFNKADVFYRHVKLW